MNKKKVEFYSDNGNTYLLDKRLGEGGQGKVYKVINEKNGKDYVVKWYNSTFGTPEQKEQIQKLVNKGAPIVNLEGIDFIWPIELVHVKNKQSFGYVMSLYDNNRYVHLNHVINGNRKQPSIDIISRISYKIAIALDSIHSKGYSYCDINLGNIQFDFDKGDIVVCDNDNVIINNSDPAVEGVIDFMAPEVTLRRDKPNVQSDLYSLAILFFQLWVWEHPMEGSMTDKVRCWDLPAKRKYYAEEPIFAYNPNDKRNTAVIVDTYKFGAIRWDVYCPQRLKQAFIHSFTQGAKYPNMRLRLKEWRNIFMEMETNSITCPTCGAVNLIDLMTQKLPSLNPPEGIPEGPCRHSNNSGKVTCFHCNSKLPVNLKMTITNQGRQISNLIVHSGVNLRQYHIDDTASNDEALAPVGKIEPHPKKSKAYILRNMTKDSWVYEVEGKSYRIDPGKARALLPEGKLSIKGVQVNIQRI